MKGKQRFHWFVLILLLMLVPACTALQPRPAAPTATIPGIETVVAENLTAVVPTGESPEETTVAHGQATQAAPPQVTEAVTTGDTATPLPPALRVAYIKDGNVWLWTEGSSSVQLTSGGGALDVALSDDGRFVAFQSQVDEMHIELRVVQTDGANERVLVDVEAFTDMDPGAVAVVPHRMAWAPGTHTLAFNTRQVLEGPGMVLYNDLRQVDVDSSRESTLLAPGQGGEFFYSPDGSQIALTTPNAIHLVNADATNRRDQLVTFDTVLTYSEYQFYPEPLWSPDGSFLRVAIPPADALAEPRQETVLWRIPADGSPAVQEASLTTTPFFAGPVVYSPDLSRIAYLRETGAPAENMAELLLANADGSNETVYHTGTLMQLLGWAGDSEHFFFALGQNRELQVGQVGGDFAPLAPNPLGVFELRPVDADRYLFIQETGAAGASTFELRLGSLTREPVLIDTITGRPPVYDFDL